MRMRLPSASSVGRLETEPCVVKVAVGASALFAAEGTGVDLAALDAVVNDFGLAEDDALLVLEIMVDPETEEKEEPGPEVEGVEDFDIKLDHVSAG